MKDKKIVDFSFILCGKDFPNTSYAFWPRSIPPPPGPKHPDIPFTRFRRTLYGPIRQSRYPTQAEKPPPRMRKLATPQSKKKSPARGHKECVYSSTWNTAIV